MTEPWYDTLPDDLKSSEHITKHKDVASLAKSHVNAQQLIDSRGNQKMYDLEPPSDATERQKVYERLGRPAAPDGYKINGAVPEFLQAAHAANLTAEQAAALHGRLSEANKAASDASSQKFKDDIAKLQQSSETAYKAKWGDEYDKEMGAMRQAMEARMSAEQIQEAEAIGLVHEPWFIEAFNTLGKAMAEDNLLGGGGGAGERDQATVEGELQELLSSAEYKEAMENPMHLKHKQYKEQYRRLMDEAAKIATKGGTVDATVPGVA